MFLLSCSFLIEGCSLTTEQQELVGHPAVSSRYYLFDGTVYALSEHSGKAVVLVFWDAFCGHCKKALPEINKLAKSFTDGSEAQFISISVNRQIDEDKVKGRLKELDIDAMTNAFSGNDVFDESFEAFRGDSVPYIVLINQEGIVSWVGRDPLELRENLIKILRKH